jgi:2-methylcitrate dehydratase PrpD
MGLLDELAEWSASVRSADIPPRCIDAARLQVLSVLASIYPGAATGNGRICREAALELGTTGRATVLPTGETAHPYAAIMANAAASMEHDFDDYLFLGHTGHSSVLASLAAAEHAGASVGDMLTTCAVANEVSGRLGAYVSIGPQNGQLWSHIHLAAGAIAGARMAGLTASQTADALGIAFYLPPFSLLPGFFGSDAKVLTAAQPASAGLYAARLAADGMRGYREILEHRRGFAAHFAFLDMPDLLRGLGRSWVSDSLSYKIYPGCAYIDGPVDAALQATRGRQLSAGEIERVDIAATALTAGMERLGEESAPDTSLDSIAVNFSARRSVAIALVAGQLTTDNLEPEWLSARADDVRSIASRTRLREDRAQTIAMLEGISNGVSLPALAKRIGLRRLLGLRTHLTDAYKTERRGPKRKPALMSRLRKGGESLSALTGVLRRLGGRGEQFDMNRADFTRLEFRFSANVEIVLRDGSVLAGSQTIPLGAAGRDRAETRGHIEDKLRAHTPAAARIIEVVYGAADRPATDLGRAAVTPPSTN